MVTKSIMTIMFTEDRHVENNKITRTTNNFELFNEEYNHLRCFDRIRLTDLQLRTLKQKTKWNMACNPREKELIEEPLKQCCETVRGRMV
jgi:hypothetical protein